MRKYAGEQELIWGGDKDCEHEWGQFQPVADGVKTRWTHNPTSKRDTHIVGVGPSTCSLCGAWKGAFGLEPSPEMYVQHTIEILREIKRVLRKDGVVFWNIGDSYAGSGSPGGDFRDGKGGDEYLRPYNRKGGILKPKDLCLIPFHVAIEARRDGWWVRSDIIWEKNNPMPESVNGWRWERHRIKVKSQDYSQYHQAGKVSSGEVSGQRRNRDAIGGVWQGGAEWRDCPGCPKCSPNDGYVLRKGSWRPTESHEYILMLTKTDEYFCDAEAVREPYTEPLNRWGGDTLKRDTSKTAEYKEMQNIGYSSAFRVGRPMRPDPSGRNLRSVWSFPTVPYPGAHFAVFPEKLPELCIKAATPEVGCCAECGAPWARVLETKPSQFNIRVRDAKAGRATPEEGYKATQEEVERYPGNHPNPGYSKTIGWRPTCKCNATRVPSIVLDNFAGAGTTLWKAKTLNRLAVGYEISQEYCQLTVDRCRQQVML